MEVVHTGSTAAPRARALALLAVAIGLVGLCAAPRAAAEPAGGWDARMRSSWRPTVRRWW